MDLKSISINIKAHAAIVIVSTGLHYKNSLIYYFLMNQHRGHSFDNFCFNLNFKKL